MLIISYFFVGSIGAGVTGTPWRPLATIGPFTLRSSVLSVLTKESLPTLFYAALSSTSLSCSRWLLGTAPTSYKGYERIRNNSAASSPEGIF